MPDKPTDVDLNESANASTPDDRKPVERSQKDSGSVKKPTRSANPVAATALLDDDDDDDGGGMISGLLGTAPAWLVSCLLHVLLLLALGLVTVADPVKIVNILTASATTEDGPEIEEFTIEAVELGEMAEAEEMTEPLSELTEQIEMTDPVEVSDVQIESVALDMSEMASELVVNTSKLQTLSQAKVAPLNGRSADMKKKLLREFGGSASSEAAVTEALKWIARHQMNNGGWTYAHNTVCNGACNHPGDQARMKSFNAATAMALLPLLGAGQTHLQGEYKGVMQKGLRFLAQNGKSGTVGGMKVLDYADGGGNFYSHGLVAITLCEAYAMTGDPDLAMPAQFALNYIAQAQCRDGGWRYRPRQPDGGDTSVTGWQIMALKSGYMGHLVVPKQTIAGSTLFLDRVGSDEGSIYGYTDKQTSLNPGCTAIGLLCRMYSGWDKNHPGMVKGVKRLAEHGVMKNDIYYNYYAAQVLRHFGGPQWEKFNKELQEWLVAEQAQQSHVKGSWFFEDSKSHRGPEEGGRLACTSFATMILEVYYRHMPLYADAAAEDDFPL